MGGRKGIGNEIWEFWNEFEMNLDAFGMIWSEIVMINAIYGGEEGGIAEMRGGDIHLLEKNIP